MNYDYTLYSWQLSMYSGKVRAYMNYKGLNYFDKKINGFDLLVKIPRKTGVRVMPVVETREGLWLQDSTMIIEALEKRHQDNSISVNTPKQYIASLLLEAWAGEYWLPTAMHYRWSYPENKSLFVKEAGEAFLPGFPQFIQNVPGQVIARGLDAARPVVGFIPEQHKMIEEWTENMLDLLEQHFSTHDYLLGGQPTIADYGLVASFYGHLNRDPAPKRILLEPRPKLQAWVKRAHGGESVGQGLYPNDEIPPTLVPVLDRVYAEFIPMLKAFAQDLNQFVIRANKQPGDIIPRFLKEVSFPMGEQTFKRATWTYTLWMAQRMQQLCLKLPGKQQEEVNIWFAEQCGYRLDQLPLGPKLERAGLKTRLA
ncbi:glutathione S-transferase family protein [Zhongshania arctica]|uniref:Glutathione S-transferase family protein n=1 Tax=Zhongshania arctica TaxID=3238302 RepID=A0ABV3U057_9GAMM